jgi:hypothetical protein
VTHLMCVIVCVLSMYASQGAILLQMVENKSINMVHAPLPS